MSQPAAGQPAAPQAASVGVLDSLASDVDVGFTTLFDDYRDLVFSTALRISGQWADAEDLTAETFLRAYRALLGYEPQRIRSLAPRAWLLAILLNAWRNSQRSRARRPVDVPLEHVAEPSDPAEPVENVVVRHESERELADLLGRLSPAQRVAVVLRYVSGLTVGEVALTMRCPEGTAKSHISRGLRRLRELRDSRDVSPTSAREVRDA